jgi:hypothetical protein
MLRCNDVRMHQRLVDYKELPPTLEHWFQLPPQVARRYTTARGAERIYHRRPALQLASHSLS